LTPVFFSLFFCGVVPEVVRLWCNRLKMMKPTGEWLNTGSISFWGSVSSNYLWNSYLSKNSAHLWDDECWHDGCATLSLHAL